MTLPFAPSGGTVVLSVDDGGTNDTLSGTGTVAVAFNAGTNGAYIVFGIVSTAAATTNFYLPPSTTQYFSISAQITHVAATCAATETATVYVIRGDVVI